MAHDPPRVKHNFVLPAFSYEQPPNTQPYIRINMFFMKRKDISWEYFESHWNHVHADIVTSSQAFKENKIIRYTQFCQTAESREHTKKCFPGYSVMEWDAASEFWVEKPEDMAAFLNSQEYIDSLREYYKYQSLDKELTHQKPTLTISLKKMVE